MKSTTRAVGGYTYQGDTSDSLVTLIRINDARGVARVHVEASATMPVGVIVTVPIARLVARAS